MNNIEQRGAAFHEASHAVIATLLGAALGNVAIRREGGTWVGDTQVSWCEGAGSARKQKTFQVAVAGPFGQVKYRACLNWDRATFDKSHSLEQVITIIREGELDEHSRLSLGFITTDGSKHVLEVKDFNDIGDLEMLKSLVHELDESVLLELLGAVRDRLDSQAVWAAISEVAESLSHQVSGHEVVAIVQKHGLVCRSA